MIVKLYIIKTMYINILNKLFHLLILLMTYYSTSTAINNQELSLLYINYNKLQTE